MPAWGKARGRQSQWEDVRAAPCTVRDKGRGSSVRPLPPPTDAGRGNIPHSFSCCFCLFLLTPCPRSLPPAGAARAISPLGWGQGWAQRQRSSKGPSCALCFSCRALPCSFPFFPVLIFTMYCHTVLTLLICPSTLISECWLLCLGSTDDWLCTMHPSINSSPIPPVPTRSCVLNQPHEWKSGVSLLHGMIYGNL